MTSSKRPDRARARRILVLACLALALISIGRDSFHGNTDPLRYGLGAGLGMLLAIQSAMLWLLLLGPVSGFSVTGATVGFGGRMAGGRIAGRGVSLQQVPLPLVTVAWVIVARGGLRARLFLSALGQTALHLGLGLWLLTGTTGWVRLVGIGLLMYPVMSLLMVGLPLSTGWVLLRMPFLPAEALTTYALRPGEEIAARALRDGRLGEAREALRRVADDAAPGFQSRLLRAGVALAEGRCAEAAVEANAALETKPQRRHAALAYALRASAIAGAAETGHLPPAQYLPWLAQAVEMTRAGQPLLVGYLPGPADLALLEGRREDAVRLARKPARKAFDRYWGAQSECSYAAALASVGRTEEARAALARARRAMPELARITVVEQRIELNVVAEDSH